MKVGVLVALLRTGGNLSVDQRLLAKAAITRSDNASVNVLFQNLEQDSGGLEPASGAIEELLREAGDQVTMVNTADPGNGFSTFGQTLWSPSESAKFFRTLARGCLLPPEQTRYVPGPMESIAPDEAWGSGTGGFPASTRVAFKGGWGPEPSGYLVRQAGIIGSSAAGAVVSMVSEARDFATGTQVLTSVARWLRSYLNLVPRARSSCSTLRVSAGP